MSQWKWQKSKCPECGKKVNILSKNDIRFCSKICETNYEYRQKHFDPQTGEIPSPEEVKKW
ncbi:MAG: hypothetical protein FJ044_01245 [Candidatus Cloacimonetes bacterium]|nr:hypothetical protein [Candidatus Cloacimonadota bacterium]